MKDDLRAAPEDYTQLAKRCVELASECSAPTVAEALRALALDYFDARSKAAQARINRVSRRWCRSYDRKTIASATTGKTATQASVKAPVRSGSIIWRGLPR